MRFFIAGILVFASIFLRGQADTNRVIKVHFLYGSKPMKKHRDTESKRFGGIHGGHVSIEIDQVEFGFMHVGKVRLFPNDRSCNSTFISRKMNGPTPHTDKDKVVTFLIPITAAQQKQLLDLMNTYCGKTPYDYAFFGMRCAAATQDVLGQLGIVKPQRKLVNVFKTFYPKRLRKRLFKLAKEKNYTIIYNEGSPTRRWEKD